MHEQGRPEAAIDAYRRAIRLPPRDPSFRCNLGCTLGGQGRRSEAIDVYRTVLRLEPEHVGATLNLAGLLQAQGRYREALGLYRRMHAVGARQENWPHPTGTWMAECERELLRQGREAAVAGFGPDEDAGEARRLRDRARGSFGAVFASWNGALDRGERREPIRAVLKRLRGDATLAGLRDRTRALPPDERRAWTGLRARLEALAARCKE